MRRTLALATGTVAFTLAVPFAVAFLAPLAIVARAGAAPPGWWPVGALVAALGGALYVVCAANFVLVGRGTPLPGASPTVFVARGPYRFVRNPMYVAVLTVVLGLAIAFGSPALLVYAAFLAVAFHVFVVLYEEPTLAATFGSSYTAYRARVSRWLPRPPG